MPEKRESLKKIKSLKSQIPSSHLSQEKKDVSLAFGLFSTSSTFLLKAVLSLSNTTPLVVMPLKFLAPCLVSARFTLEAVVAEVH